MAFNGGKRADIRIALVTGGLRLGGATTLLCNLAGELKRRDIPVTVLSLEKDNPLSVDFVKNGIQVSCQDEGTTIYEDRVAAVYRQLCGFRPTAVVAWLGGISFEVLRHLPPGVFRVGMAHGDEAGVYATMRRHGFHLDMAAGVSSVIAERLGQMPEYRGKIVRYLPCGAPMPQTLEARSFKAPRPLRILYLGRLDQIQKRVRLFPRLLAQLRDSGIPFSWTIAGDGPDRAFLEETMRMPAGVQEVSLIGPVLYHQVPSLLETHDIFLLCSDFEGLPVSLLEAMGHGMVPVVSDLRSGIREVVDEGNGKKVSPEDTQGYGAAIVWLHNHRDQMEAMSRMARAKVAREFSVSAMADRWLENIPSPEDMPPPWPGSIRILPPLGLRRAFRFSWPGRFLARRLIKLRTRCRGR